MNRILFEPLKRCSHQLALRDKALIGGKWMAAQSGKMFDVIDPADGSIIGQAPDMAVEDTEMAVKEANVAFQSWKLRTAKERGVLLRRWYELLTKNADDLAHILTLESGKPLAESKAEIAYGNSFVEWFAEEARHVYGDVACSPVPNRELVFLKQPIGAVGLITPWNFPHAMIARKAGAALAAGCTCVVKPAEDTPFTALAMAEICEQADIPSGVFNVVTSSRSNAPSIGKFLCEHPDIAGISFTGSTAVGKLLYQQCASGIKRISLELGGNAPFVVFEGCDIDKAVTGALAAKFRNCGQTCVSANRFLVQRTVFHEFITKFSQGIKSLKMGDGKNPACNLGPLINLEQLRKVNNMVTDAVNLGATVVCGGKKSALGERFFEPTLLTDISPDMACYKEEVFGPVAACVEFDTEEEAVRVANATERGLAGYFYTKDISQAWRVAKALQVGMVGVNEGLISCAEAPFGGVKESGIGREGSKYGLDEYLYIKYLCFGNL